MATREILQNRSSTTLNGALTNVATSVVVTDGSVFPSNGDFRVIVNSEIMLVTARSSNTLTAVRGRESTTAVAHSTGDTIKMLLTAESIQQYMRDNDYAFDTSRPPQRIVDSTGAVLNAASFTLIGANSTKSDVGDAILLKKTSAGTSADFSMLYRSAPATPYNVVAAVRMFGLHTAADGSLMGVGIGFRDSVDGNKFIPMTFQYRHQTTPDHTTFNVSVFKYDTLTSFSAGYLSATPFVFHGDLFWFKISNDGTDLTFYASGDGVTWVTLHGPVSKTDFLPNGPDQIAFMATHESGDSRDAYAILAAWDEGA